MLNPRRLILKLLLAADHGVLSTREAVAAGGLMGDTQNSVRVALARLASQQLIESAGRGVYRLGPAAQGLAEDVKRWRSGETRVVPWQGEWLAMHTGGLSRSDRTALRVRERALQLLGLREVMPDLYLRPDNLRGGIEAVRSRLRALGVATSGRVFALRQIDATLAREAAVGWDGEALSAGYRQQRVRLEEWMVRAATLPAEAAAREAFVMGDAAIRAVVFDPLLPDPMVDVAARAAFTDTVLRYDRLGHQYWQRLFAPAPPPLRARGAAQTAAAGV